MMDKIDNQRIGKNIRRYRKFAGMSQKDLATAANISPGSISVIETAKCCISLESIFKISNVLDVSIMSLIGDNHDNIQREQIIKMFKHISNLNEKDKKLTYKLINIILEM